MYKLLQCKWKNREYVKNLKVTVADKGDKTDRTIWNFTTLCLVFSMMGRRQIVDEINALAREFQQSSRTKVSNGHMVSRQQYTNYGGAAMKGYNSDMIRFLEMI